MGLSDGLVLRTAEPQYLDQIGALLAERGEPEDAVDHRLVVEDPDAGWEACADLWMPHAPALWRWLVARGGSAQWLVERDGVPVGTGRSTPPEEGVQPREVAAVDADAVHALLAHTGATSANERPGTVAGRALEPFLRPALEPFLGPAAGDANSYYVLAGATPVLVHNSGGAWKEVVPDSFGSFEQARDKAVGFTARVNGEVKRFGMDHNPVKGFHIDMKVGEGDSARKWAVPRSGTEDDFAKMLGGNP
ncbi:hypothetical protein [Saccharothrix algeriensis]|uniref:Uncharacterized protein n=1 Tax=Saccharothrix algeriensis TaxID=173560 RepID=A0ABS2S1B6_9PSEU|nr:hypothetical protein [Saccharothrix algeriensis]MBM7809504.1 hypothetical protein [Saccharothrix algeriensis]